LLLGREIGPLLLELRCKAVGTAESLLPCDVGSFGSRTLPLCFYSCRFDPVA
jgi:hypothetical protein